MSTGIKPNGTEGIKKLLDMISRGKDKKAAFARVYPMYQRLQIERFETENSSEGDHWKDLNSDYAKYKLKRYGGGPRRKSKNQEASNWNSYPGGGRKMLVGTGMLAGAAIGPGQNNPFVSGVSNHRAMFTESQMIISVEESGKNPDGNNFDYAQFVSEQRQFMKFSSSSIHEMKKTVTEYVLGG